MLKREALGVMRNAKYESALHSFLVPLNSWHESVEGMR